MEQLQQAEQVHTEIYQLVREITTCLAGKNYDQAQQIFSQANILSQGLDEILDQLEKQMVAGEQKSSVGIASENIPEWYTSSTVLSEKQAGMQGKVSFETLAENTDVLILFTDQDGSIFYVNPSWVHATHRTLQKVTRNGWTDMIHPDDLSAATDTMAEAFTSKKTTCCEIRIHGNEGRDKWFSLQSQPWRQADGRFAGCIIALTDIDQHKAIAFDNKIKTAVLDRCELIIGISLVNPMPEPIYNNSYTLKKLGWQTGKGRTLIDAIYPDDRTKVMQLLPELIAQKEGSHEIRLYNELTGEPFWIQWDVMVLDQIEKGFPSILATISPEITQRKQNELLLRQREGALMNALEIARLGTWTMEIASRKAVFSGRHLEMFGVRTNHMNIEEAISHVVDSDKEQLSKAFFDAQKPGSDGKFDAEYTIINASTGKKQVIRTLGQTYFDTDGTPLSIAGIAQDINEYRDLQWSLEAQVLDRTRELHQRNMELAAGHDLMQQANLQLIRSNEDLHRFAYVASHDLQEPLRKIQLFTNRLETEITEVAPRMKDYLDRVRKAAERMSMLINDLLIFSNVSNDMMQQMHTVVLTDLMEQAIANLRVPIADSNASIDIKELPQLKGNAKQLRQLFQNLISNALKFHRIKEDGRPVPPRIKVRSELMEQTNLPAGITPFKTVRYYHQISVQDNGIGFEEMYLNRIFKVFQRLHNRSKYSGTGIGLAICERIVANHGGVITARSQPGKGSTFYIYLPRD
ncbi:PAS domain-containing sensor histidine kinase [Dyadobacter sediminis]|uniref:histidine kinase n=1 Tax=Dyadobacter sediminis TaxID=1493691 RepID=A0A5R9KMJ2_9BACT|nr:ATP-binding protein [Dyadobacter sediminis]TLU97447.1 PAS domain S-box protein [Dyadobacter sediminis]GGC15053.1 hypothetical protein GCM10011325_47350 [Dyadobacter sediminis]